MVTCPHLAYDYNYLSRKSKNPKTQDLNSLRSGLTKAKILKGERLRIRYDPRSLHNGNLQAPCATVTGNSELMGQEDSNTQQGYLIVASPPEYAEIKDIETEAKLEGPVLWWISQKAQRIVISSSGKELLASMSAVDAGL